MPRFTVNFDNVASVLSKRSYKLSEVQDKIEKVAWDVVRFTDGAPEELWQIQNSDEGDYIVALYNEEDKVATASSQPWAVVVKNSDLHIFYKQNHLAKIAASALGFSDNDLHSARKYLPTRLAQNKHLVSSLLNTLAEDDRTQVLSTYPELA